MRYVFGLARVLVENRSHSLSGKCKESLIQLRDHLRSWVLGENKPQHSNWLVAKERKPYLSLKRQGKGCILEPQECGYTEKDTWQSCDLQQRSITKTQQTIRGNKYFNLTLFQTLIFRRHFPLVEHYQEPEGKGGFMQPDLVTAFQIRMKGIQRILEGQMKGK